MAMTEEERKEARRLAAKKWYETHKKAKHAVKSAKPARKTEKPDKAKAEIEKRVAKLVTKGDKAVASMKALIKDAAAVATDVHKTGDDKLIHSVMSKLMRSLSLGISPVENGKGVLSSTLQAAYRVPKTKTAPQPEQGPDVSEEELEVEPESVEIPVGDDGDVEAASDDEILEASDSEAYDDDSDPDDPEKPDSDDEDDEDDEDIDGDYSRGREDMFREMAEMGFGEEDE